MNCSVLHHIEICVKEEAKLFGLLTKGFGFCPFACRLTSQASRWALRSGGSVFVITKRNESRLCEYNLDDGVKNDVCIDSKTCNGLGSVDTESSSSINQEVTSDTNREIDNVCPEPNNLTKTGDAVTHTEEKSHRKPEHWTVFCCQKKGTHTIDSVFNVALVVKDVDKVTERVRSRGGTVIREPADLCDASGRVRYSIVTSCCGNIVHTLIDKKHYTGDFLPGYKDYARQLSHDAAVQQYANGMTISEHCDINNVSVDKSLHLGTKTSNGQTEKVPHESLIASSNQEHWPEGSPISTFIDHVTYVCEIGKSQDLIAWYEYCFGMKRFLTNKEESETEGFVLGGNIGLRLKALEYWRCSEVGLAAPSTDTDDASLKLVIAEALPNVDQSAVNTFLHSHCGPGIQHIGLHTPTMIATVHHMTHCGVLFRKPPPVYYQEQGIKLEEIQEVGHGEELEKFRELGILLDTEADAFTSFTHHGRKRYLMQVFTTSIFTEDTFFLEIIQRCGAEGFGAGNITALAKSIIWQLENGSK